MFYFQQQYYKNIIFISCLQKSLDDIKQQLQDEKVIHCLFLKDIFYVESVYSTV